MRHLIYNISLLSLLSFGQTIFGQEQRLEKIRGDRNVTTEPVSIQAYQRLEVGQNIELDLEFQPVPTAVVEADQNLLPYIRIESLGGTLKVSSTKDITKSKTLIIHLGFNDLLTEITATGKSIIRAQNRLENKNMSITALDHAELDFNIKSKSKVSVELSGKAEIKSEIKAQEISIKGIENTDLDLFLDANLLQIDLEQKSKLELKGASGQTVFTTSGNTYLNAAKHKCSKLALVTTDNTQNYVFASDHFELTSSKKAESYLFGKPSIEITNFSDESLLSKTNKVPSSLTKILN